MLAQVGVQGIYGSLTPIFNIASSTSANGTATSSLFRVNADGRIGVGTTSPFSLFSIFNSTTTNANGALQALFSIGSSTNGLATSSYLTVASTGGIIQGGSGSTIAAGTGAGTSPTLVAIAGNANAGFIQITTGTTPTAAATVATITLPNMTCSKDIYTVITPGNSTTAGLSGTSMVFASSSGSKTSWVITSNSIAILGATAYAWNYHTNCSTF